MYTFIHKHLYMYICIRDGSSTLSTFSEVVLMFKSTLSTFSEVAPKHLTN